MNLNVCYKINPSFPLTQQDDFGFMLGLVSTTLLIA